MAHRPVHSPIPHPYIALYHVTREQGTLVAPRLWAEEGVGRAKLNNEKATALRLR